MRSTLCEATARCHGRRLRGVAAAAPLPVGVVGLVVLLAPFVLFRLGGAVGKEVSGSITDASVSAGLTLGPLLAAAVAGAALAVAAPTRSALGSQIAAGPSGAAVVVVAVALVPAAAGAVVVVPSLVAICTGLGHALPGGAGSGLALAAATFAAVPAGAVVAEGGIAVGRGQLDRAAAVGAGVLSWLALGLALGAAALGPLAAVPVALRGERSAWLALGVSALAGLGLGCAWVALAATRAEPRSRPRAMRRVGRRRMPAPVAATVLLSRRGDLRLATVGATVFGLAGAAVGAAGAVPSPAPFLLGSTTALLGSLLCPLVVGGVLVDGRWLWQSAPVGRSAVARAFAVVSTVAAALPVAVVGCAATVISGTKPGTLGVVAVLVIVGSGLAVLAGAMVPWRSGRAGDQMTTIAAFAAIAIAASLVVGFAAPRLVAAGIPDAVVIIAIGVAAAATALAALDRRLGAVGS